MSELAINILGFPAVNRDLTVELRDPTSNTLVREVRPFTDGTAQLLNIQPGAYEMLVRHSNLATPVIRRPIRVLPDGPTQVSVLIDPSQFRNTPIEDIPDADLTPARQTAESISETLVPVASKRPGESIKAEDWNLIATSIRHLADGMAQLTRLVSPQGHSHPELEQKINEITGNFDTLVNALSAAMAELQRQIQSLQLRRQIQDVFDATTGVVPPDKQAQINAARTQALALADHLEGSITDSPATFGRKVRNVGVQLDSVIETVMTAVPDDTNVQQAANRLSESGTLLKTHRADNYGDEIALNRKKDRALGGGGLLQVLKQQ